MRLSKALRIASVLVGFAWVGLQVPGCADGECKFNSDCGAGLCVAGKCERECFASIDCPKARPVCARGTCVEATVDGGAPPDAPATDAGVDAPKPPLDTGAPPPDTTVDPVDASDTAPPPIDTSAPPADTGAGTKGYLTGCASDAECASGACAPTTPRFCTKPCASHAECAHGQICAAGTCRNEDTGTPCTSGSSCLQYCGGITGASTCTHSCATAADCPAGYACTNAGGAKICVDIERPCSAPTQCPSGLGFCGTGGVGCTAECTTAADCPARLVGLPAYTCAPSGGKTVCVVPSDVKGGDALGASCAATGVNTCRSGACDSSTAPPSCAQRCTVRGGCPVAWGCFPLEDPGPPKETLLVCSPAGAQWLGTSCTRGRDCLSGLCQSPGYCTRMCADGYCPDGMTCVASGLTANDGTPIKLCTK